MLTRLANPSALLLASTILVTLTYSPVSRAGDARERSEDVGRVPDTHRSLLSVVPPDATPEARFIRDRWVKATPERELWAAGAAQDVPGATTLLRVRLSLEPPAEGCNIEAFEQETMASLRRTLPNWIALGPNGNESSHEDLILLVSRLKCVSSNRTSLKSREDALASPIIEEGLRYQKLATELKSVNDEISLSRHSFPSLTPSGAADRLPFLSSSYARPCIPGVSVQAVSGQLLDRADELLAEMMDLTARRGAKGSVPPLDGGELEGFVSVRELQSGWATPEAAFYLGTGTPGPANRGNPKLDLRALRNRPSRIPGRFEPDDEMYRLASWQVARMAREVIATRELTRACALADRGVALEALAHAIAGSSLKVTIDDSGNPLDERNPGLEMLSSFGGDSVAWVQEFARDCHARQLPVPLQTTSAMAAGRR